MSWVHLSDLLSPDRNFRGLLDGLLEETVTVKITEDGEKYVSEKAKEIFGDGITGTMKELCKNREVNIPEWSLFPDGKLYMWDIFDLGDDGIKSLKLLEIDIKDWLSNQKHQISVVIAKRALSVKYGWRDNPDDSFLQNLINGEVK